MKELALQAQELIIYVFIGIAILVVLVDLIPLKWLKSKKVSKLSQKEQGRKIPADSKIVGLKQKVRVSQMGQNNESTANGISQNIFSTTPPDVIIIPKAKKKVKRPRRIS